MDISWVATAHAHLVDIIKKNNTQLPSIRYTWLEQDKMSTWARDQGIRGKKDLLLGIT
jgi:hypothetical protein